MNKRLKAVFSGSVQGVGFRYTAERLAAGFPVTGYVRNLTNGQVELVAEGEEGPLRDFLTALRDSSLSSCIRGVTTEWSGASGEFAAFRTRR